MSGLKVASRRGLLYATGTIAGERIRKSLKTRDKAQAAELCAQYEAKLWKRHSYGEEAVRTFAEAAESYLKEGGEVRFIVPLIERFGTRVLGTIKPGEIQKAARSLYPGKSGSTWNRQVIVPTRAVINHAAGLGWCAPIRVSPFPTPKARRVAVGREWIDSFLAKADAVGLPHLSAAVLFMWQTGTRISETARIMPEHVNLRDRIVVLERTKTSTWEARHISHELMVRIANLPQTPGEPLFGYSSRFGIRNRMKSVCQRAGLPWVPPHQAGRHSFATNALAMGASLKQVMEAGGWKTARMILEVYAHAEGAGKAIATLFDTQTAQQLRGRDSSC